MKDIPIVLAAFGTTTRALETYDFIGEHIERRFPGHAVHWAYSSRMVRSRLKVRKGIELPDPGRVLAGLEQEGHSWAVVQSMHLVCGHEFYRLVEEVAGHGVRVSMGLPLLAGPADYRAAARAVDRGIPCCGEEALLLVGHGTDHPIWCAYPALEGLFRETCHRRVFVGVVEGDAPRQKTLDAIRKAGIRRVMLVPFMLVAGTHFLEDLAGEEDSWRQALESAGLEVILHDHGLGLNPAVVECFAAHIREALDVIPTQAQIGGVQPPVRHPVSAGERRP